MKNIKNEKKNVTLGYSRQKRHIRLSSPLPLSLEILDLSLLSLQVPEKTSFSSGNPAKFVWHTLEIPRSKTKTHGNSTGFFLEFSWKFHFFFNSPLEFPHILFNILGNSMKFHFDFSEILE